MIFPKLRSQAGASLIAALFLFLFCAMTGTVILTAASANAGRLSRGDRLVGSGGGAGEKQYEDERQYSRVISAAKLFADQIKGKTVKLSWTRTWTYDDYSNYTEAYSYSVAPPIPSGDALSDFFVAAVTEIYGQTLTDNKEKGAETWEANFTNIKSQSEMKEFTMTSTISGDSPIYGRIAFQGRNCVLRAIFSTEQIVDNKIPETAYVALLTCVPDEPEDGNGVSEWFSVNSGDDSEVSQTKTITLQWNGAQITEER
ncbi:MAG: hypothetical protein IKN96_05785 [Oscillibacter sp.]|nr:hypothetical protein [Oscillibacter sp.]